MMSQPDSKPSKAARRRKAKTRAAVQETQSEGLFDDEDYFDSSEILEEEEAEGPPVASQECYVSLLYTNECPPKSLPVDVDQVRSLCRKFYPEKFLTWGDVLECLLLDHVHPLYYLCPSPNEAGNVWSVLPGDDFELPLSSFIVPGSDNTLFLATCKPAPEAHQEIKDMLVSCSSMDENVRQEVTNKFLQLLTVNETLLSEIFVFMRSFAELAKDRNRLKGELVKTNTMKSKLEGVCRELQRQNRSLKEENKKIEAVEAENRRQLSCDLSVRLRDLHHKIEVLQDQRDIHWRQSDVLREKLKNMVEQYDLREKLYQTQMKQKESELKLMEAKIKHNTNFSNNETIKGYRKQIAYLCKTETDLRQQLMLYAEKFEQFQDTLSKSNDVFSTFKQEMEKMTKTIKKSEKDNTSLRKKCEQTNLTLIELAEERNNYRKQVESLKVQKKKLEGLCRALQSERKSKVLTGPAANGPLLPSLAASGLATGAAPPAAPADARTCQHQHHCHHHHHHHTAHPPPAAGPAPGTAAALPPANKSS